MISLNSRPLCVLPNDPSGLTCLTLGHFLIDTSLTTYPERDVIDVPESALIRWQKFTQIEQLFSKHWSTEYYNRLQNRPKWFQSPRNLKIKDIVPITEDNTPLNWPLERILEIIPGEYN